jgi:hypothetical protein
MYGLVYQKKASLLIFPQAKTFKIGWSSLYRGYITLGIVWKVGWWKRIDCSRSDGDISESFDIPAHFFIFLNSKIKNTTLFEKHSDFIWHSTK